MLNGRRESSVKGSECSGARVGGSLTSTTDCEPNDGDVLEVGRVHVFNVVWDAEVLDLQAFEVFDKGREDDFFATVDPVALCWVETDGRSDPLDVGGAFGVDWSVAFGIGLLSKRLTDEGAESSCYLAISRFVTGNRADTYL